MRGRVLRRIPLKIHLHIDMHVAVFNAILMARQGNMGARMTIAIRVPSEFHI